MVMNFLVPASSSTSVTRVAPWKILLVDDDPDVHDVTKIAVAGYLFEERQFQLVHAHSASEARQVLLKHSDIALALVDVVMEKDTAGLDLVSWIRDELGNPFMRLILRTGQPGYAPQADVIMKFDVDGYAEKAELSRTKLLSTIVAALRGYKLLTSLETKRRKLEKLNAQFTGMLVCDQHLEFADSALSHLAELFGRQIDSIFCGFEEGATVDGTGSSNVLVQSSVGCFGINSGVPLEALVDASARKVIKQCIETKSAVSTDNGLAYPLLTGNGMGGALFVAVSKQSLEEDVGEDVFQLFVSNIALGYEKISLLRRIRNLAYVDPLTGLFTLSGFEETIQRHSARGCPLLVAQFDIQRFRVIVDGIGDEKAGAFLKKTGKRLSELFEDALCIARKEKDEFLLLFADCSDQKIQDVVARVESAFQEPVSHEDFKITLQLRIGFAPSETGMTEPDQLVRFASIALNDVRQKKRANFAVFHSSMQEAALERLRLASLLSNSADETELSLDYQPIMSASDERIVSVEALMRFRTREGILLNTSNVIEATEASGLIVDLGAWMFKAAFSQLNTMTWLPQNTLLNVNLSPRQVQSNRIYKDIESASDEAGLPLNRLVFEVTEGLFVNNDQVTMALLCWLRSQGAKVVIDDFGTGYSSFSYLRKLPVDGIKIDRSFIMNMEQDLDAQAVVKSIVAVAKALDMTVTAEGVETPGQRELIQKLHCDFLQGFFYAEPLSCERLEAFAMNLR